jgi:hypothetical protein
MGTSRATSGRGGIVIKQLLRLGPTRLRRFFRISPERGWRRYQATGDMRGALAQGVGQAAALRFSIDRAVAAGEFFHFDGWLLGPRSQHARLEVFARTGPCNCVTFRCERYDVNDAFKLPRFFPNQHLGFRIFGRLPPPVTEPEPVLGLAIIGRGENDGGAEKLLSTLPMRVDAGDSALIRQPLLESIRRHLPASDADLENAALLLNQLRSRGLDRRKAPAFPDASGASVDVLILARRRPEVAEMNAALIQEFLPLGSRIFVAAGDWNASRSTGRGIAARPPEQALSLHYLQAHEAVPSSLVIASFLRSDHAPCVVIVMDDVFIAPCLPSLSAAIAERRSLAVPRAGKLAPAPDDESAPARDVPPRRDLLRRGFRPLGVMVLDERDALRLDAFQQYDDRGFALEDLFNANRGTIPLSDQFCLDLLPEDESGDAQYLAGAPAAEPRLAEA